MSTKLGTLTLDLVARVSGFTQGMNQASTTAEREMRRVENSVVTVDGLIKKLAVTAGATFSVAQITNYADGYTGMVNKLKLVTNGQGQLSTAMNDTHKIAQATASDWNGVLDVYTKFQGLSKRLGIDQMQVARITETVTKTVAMSGQSAASSEAALLQFGQALNTGFLRGAELTSVLSQAPALAKAIADGMGVAIGDLKKLGEDGKITSEVMRDALLKMSSSVDAEYAKTATTVAASFNLIRNETIRAVGEFDSATGASKTFVKGMTLLSENMDVVTNTMMVGAAFMAGTYIPVIYKSLAAKKAKITSMIEEIQIENASIVQSQRKAQAEFTAAQAEMTRARDSVIAAEMEVNADRAVIASEIQRMQATVAATNVEKVQEAQRLKNQIADTGRTQSITRMAQLQQVQAIQVAELTALEAKLGATVVATSQQYTAARNVETGATTRLTVATSELNVANAMTTRTSFGLMGALGGPVGLGLVVAGVAASYLMLRDSTKDTTSTLDLQKGTVSELVAEYSKLDDLQKRTTMRELEKQVRDLSTAYTVSFSDLNAFIGWLEDSGSVSESTAKDINDLFKEYRKGSLSASDFATAINGLSGVQGKHKQKIDDLTTAQAKSKTEYEKVKTAQDALTKQTSSAVKANKDEAESIDAKRLAQEKLSALDKSYAQKNLDIDFSRINIKNHGLEMGKALADFYDENKLSKTQKLSVEQWGIFQKNFSKQQELKNLENDITQSKKDQTKELEKQQKALQVNAKVQANAVKYNFNGIEGKYGLPSGLLSGVHMQESRGNVNAVGPQTKYGTAKGGFQFLDSTAGRFKLFGNDVFDLGKSADAAGQYLQILYKKFGDWDKAISAYHAGEGNVAAGTNIGPVNRQYVQNVKGYIAGVSGYSGSSKEFDSSMDDQAKYAQKTLEEIDQLNAKYSNADVIRNKDRLAEIAEAERLGQTQLIDQINLRYSDESYLAKLQLDQQVNGWKWVGEERINKEAEVNRAVTNASKELSKDQKQLVMNGIDALSKYEIDEYRKTQKLKIAEYQLAFSQPLTDMQAEVLDMQAKANMGGGYGTWALQNQYGKDLNSFGDDYDKNVNNINEDKTITDDATRKQLLLQAEESFRQSKLALNEKYTLLEQDLAKSQHQEQLQIWGSLLGQAQNTWSQITQAVKDSNGEQSASFKAAFLMQQAMAFASAIVSAHLAAVETTADITLPFVGKIPAAQAILAFGYANAGVIAAQTITGMAHNGIDNIPKEGTWLLDGGERVLNPQQNKDLTNYLAKGSGSGGMTVTVNNYGNDEVETSQDADGNLMVTIGKLVKGMVKNETDQRFKQALRQGGELYGLR